MIIIALFSLIIFTIFIAIAILCIIVYLKRRTNRNLILKRLKNFVSKNKVKQTLINPYCELRFWQSPLGGYCFSCKERTNGTNTGRIFVVAGNDSHVSTMWAIMNMEYSITNNWEDFRELYITVQEDIWYFYNEDPPIEIFPENEAQNEYCRMVLVNNNYEDYKIICTEIWNFSKQPKFFEIRSNYNILCKILNDFKTCEYKFEKFDELLQKYQLMGYVQQNNAKPTISSVQEKREQNTDNIREFLLKQNNEREVDL